MFAKWQTAEASATKKKRQIIRETMIQIAFGFSVGRSSKQKGKKTSTV